MDRKIQMMLAYSMKIKENGNFLLEKATGLEIPVNGDLKIAKDIMRNVNMGGGFNEFTPTFFTWKYKENN